MQVSIVGRYDDVSLLTSDCRVTWGVSFSLVEEYGRGIAYGNCADCVDDGETQYCEENWYEVREKIHGDQGRVQSRAKVYWHVCGR